MWNRTTVDKSDTMFAPIHLEKIKNGKTKIADWMLFHSSPKIEYSKDDKKGVKDNITDIKANANRGNNMTIEQLTKNDKRNIENWRTLWHSMPTCEH